MSAARGSCGGTPHEPGAEVWRLHPREGTSSRGHALLIGAPLDRLGNVDVCLGLVRRWLGPDYEAASDPRRSTKAGIAREIQLLRARVEPGDQVLIYYAGHGVQQVSDAAVHDRPVTVLSPMDARGHRPPQERFITGEEVAGWVHQLASACRPLGAEGDEASVTVILDCCHAAGVLEAWPEDQQDQQSILDAIDARYRGPQARKPSSSAPRTVWVLASGRDEQARGPESRQVGLFTQNVSRLLRDHPGEPWWALMDRLRSDWDVFRQSPALVGAKDLVPLVGGRVTRPDGWFPCVRLPSAPSQWRIELADVAGWHEGDCVAFMTALGMPPVAHGTMERHAGELRMSLEGAGRISPDVNFGWARRPALSRSVVVEVWGGSDEERAGVLALVSEGVGCALDEGAPCRDRPQDGLVGLAVDDGQVAVIDRWGNRLARTLMDEYVAWIRWISWLKALEDWAEVEEAGWPAEAFELRWGRWDEAGKTVAWEDDSPVVPSETPLWLEVVSRAADRPAHTAVFRIRGDRAVEILSDTGPDGRLPVTGPYPEARLGTRSVPLSFDWPEAMSTAECTEEIFVMISDRPLSFSLLEHRLPARGGRGTPARMAILKRRYRLRRTPMD